MALTPQERVFATEVDRARSAARVSQEWLGRQIQMSRSKVSEICNGRYLPTHDTVLRLVEALAMDKEQTFALWRAARDAREARRDAERQALAAPPPSRWDRVPALPPEIVSLMRAQILAAEDLPYRLPGAKRPSLSTVYVRQDLGRPGDDATVESRANQEYGHRRGDDSAETFDHRIGSAQDYVAYQSATGSRGVRPPARPVRAALDGDQHLLITAGPGQGKSTLTLRLAADVARLWLEARSQDDDVPLIEPVIPLRLPAREVAEHLDMPLPEALAKSVAAEFGSLLKTEVPARVLAGRVLNCRWLLLVDAIDEIVDREQQERLLRALSHLAADESDPAYRVLVTSRPLGGTGLGILHRAGVARYELQPFDAEALRLFAEHWFTAEGASDGELLCRRFLTQVREAHLAELVRVPLLATIAAIISEQHRDRPLPDNRHDLYETYLDYIARRSGPRQRSESVFREIRTPLLEHLGVVRLTTTGSLAKAAREWVSENMPLSRLPMDWQSDLTTYLATTSPMIVRRNDLEFLHHSFADHLAATAQARRLPALFDSGQDVWREILHNASDGYSKKHAEAVLLHYGHLHPDQADEMVRWLCGNTADFQYLAAALLAQHFPAGAETIDAFLDKVWSWALTMDGWGARILNEVSKATHHPRLSNWLRTLMSAWEAPWRSRIQAAVTLCTLFEGEDHGQALALLQEAMQDPLLERGHRLAAARGLVAVGAEQHACAAEGLRNLLTDADVDPVTRRTAAVTLADLGDDARAFATDALLTVLADPTMSLASLQMAAIGIAEIGPEFEAQAASVLHEIAADQSCFASERRSAALALGGLGPFHREEAAAHLESLWCDKDAPIFHRCKAAVTLSELGPEYSARAAVMLTDLVASPSTRPTDLWWVVTDLARLSPSSHEAAAAQLRRILSNPLLESNARLWTIDALSKLGIAFHAEVVDEYRKLWADPFAGEYDRCQAMANLANLGLEYRDEAAELLLGITVQPTANAAMKLEAARMLSRLDPQFHAEAGSLLHELMIDDSLGDGVRLEAAEALAKLGNRFHGEIGKFLNDILDHPWSGSERRTMPSDWKSLAPYFRNESLTALRIILHDASREDHTRAAAAISISDLDREGTPEAVSVLCTILGNRSDRQQDLVYVAERLVAFGSNARSAALTTVQSRLSSPTGPAARLYLAKALKALGDEHLDQVADELRSVLSDPVADADVRVRAGSALAELGQQFHPEAADVLTSLIETPFTDSFHWPALSTALARLGTVPLDRAASALRAVLSDAARNGRAHLHAASALGGLGPAFRHEGAKALRRIASDHDVPADVRINAAWNLMDLLHASQEDSIACLVEISSDPCQKFADRCRAVERLVQLEQQRMPQAIRDLRTWLKHRHAKPADVLVVVASLRRLCAITEEEAHLLRTAVANDPAAEGQDRRTAITQIGKSGRRPDETQEGLRALLRDRMDWPGNRIPGRADLATTAAPLKHEVESVLNELLASPEYGRAERLDALRKMGQLGGAHRKNAAAILREAIKDEESGTLPFFGSLNVLEQFGGEFRVEACDIADRVVTDERRPLRARLTAAKISLRDVEPRPAAVELARQALHQSGRSRFQIEAASALLALGPAWRVEAVGELRRLAQDDQANSCIRIDAAWRLAVWSPQERDTAAAVADAFAGDPTAGSALRSRAAQTLARHYGARFRPAGLAHLLVLATDGDVAASARVGAAEVVTDLDPRQLPTVMKVLRGIASDDGQRPAARIQAMAALGRQGRGFVDEAVAGLRLLVDDASLGLVIRGKAATEMAKLHRDRQEDAALVMQEIIRSPGTAVHTRWSAAQWLAWLSPISRDEAVACLTALLSEPWQTGTRRT